MAADPMKLREEPAAQEQWRLLRQLQEMGFSYEQAEIAVSLNPTLEGALSHLTHGHEPDTETGYVTHIFLETHPQIDECSNCGRPRACHIHDFMPVAGENPEDEPTCALCRQNAAHHTAFASLTAISVISDGDHVIEVAPPELDLARRHSFSSMANGEEPRALVLFRQASLKRQASLQQEGDLKEEHPVVEKVEINLDDVANRHVPSEDDIEREQLLANKREVEEGKGETCAICFDEYHDLDMVTLPCHHKFCFFCCRGLFHNQIRDGVVKELLKCPDVQCRVPVPPESVKPVVSEAMWSKYEMFARNHEVRINPLARFCPTPHCDNILYGHRGEKRLVCGKCRYEMCFECNNPYHGNSDCSKYMAGLVNQWAEGRDVRPCPQCRMPIEKADGCNHMRCKCGFQFCWLCGGAYTENHYDMYNIFGCPGQQYNDDRPNIVIRCLPRLGLFILGLFGLAVYAFICSIVLVAVLLGLVLVSLVRLISCMGCRCCDCIADIKLFEIARFYFCFPCFMFADED